MEKCFCVKHSGYLIHSDSARYLGNGKTQSNQFTSRYNGFCTQTPEILPESLGAIDPASEEGVLDRSATHNKSGQEFYLKKYI